MRLLFVCPRLAIGGAERQWGLLVPALVERGFHASVLALQEEGPVAEELRRHDVLVMCANVQNRYDVRGLHRALRLADGDFNIIVTRSIDAHVVGSVIARRTHAVHVTVEHSHYDLLPLRPHQRILYRLVTRRAEAAVAVASSQLPVLEELGYPRSALRVIPNGVPVPQTTRSPAETRALLGLSGGDFVIAQVAMLRPEKRADIFVESVVRAHRNDPRIRGLVVGDGSEGDRVRALCAKTAGAVIAVGARSDIADVFAAVDAACLTSVGEALPLSLLEAAALGRPLVATDVGGTRDLVRTNETGYLLPVNDVQAISDAIGALAANPEHAAALGRRAQDLQRKRFSAEAMFEAYEQLLRSLALSAGAQSLLAKEEKTEAGAI